MVWVLWFAFVSGPGQAFTVAEFDEKEKCEKAAKALREIDGVVFDCRSKKL